MSTDGDDIDEDELLQQAVKEQAARKVEYKRPASKSKPVLNMVRAPPPRSFLNKDGGASKHAKASVNVRENSADDDDDSEVEMLSISSGDEDSSKGQAQAAKGHPSAVRRGGRSDSGDVPRTGEEPDCWKRVDEAELARRVREMRETRTTPVIKSLDQEAIMGQKGLARLQSISRGKEFFDPLGLGIIDSRTLTLITSSETFPAAKDQFDKDTLDPNIRAKLLYFSEDFDAKLFLSRIHQYTSAVDLEAGAYVVKTDLKGRTKQKKQLVKENFDCFVSCKTTIDDIESKLRRIEDDPEGAGTARLHSAINNINSLANRAFEPLFERQVQAEKIRSVQGIFQRFQTLFNLPSAIRGSISKGEYDLAVREYQKAKSIALPSHVGILKRVQEEVEKVMQEFKGMLYKSMDDPQITLADLENTVRLLLELEPDSYPIWHYLNLQNRRIQGLLERCTLDHEVRMEALQNEIQKRKQSDLRWRQLQQDSNKSSDVNFSLLLGDIHSAEDLCPDAMSEEIDALRGRFICKLTAVIIHHVPAFWRLTLSVFGGKFAKSSQVGAGNMLLDAEPNVKAAASRAEDKASDAKYSCHSLDEVAELLHSTVSLYESKVSNSFRDMEESNILCSYMSDAVKEISKACHAIEGKEAAPFNAIKTLRILQSEITKIYILRLCSWMRSTTEEISKNEAWIPISTLQRNKSPYTISFLPVAFQTLTVAVMDQINTMIQSMNEATKSNDMLLQVQAVKETVRLAFLNCFLDFAGYLERMGGEISLSKSNKETINSDNGLMEPEVKSFQSTAVVFGSHQKLLMILSNIGFCKDQLSSELYNKYKHIWLQSRDKSEGDSDIQDLVLSFAALEEKILEQYTYAKAKLMREAATKYLLDAGVQWGGAPPVKGVRNAAVELLHTLVAVHAEVFSGAKPLLEKILSILVEGLIDTLLSLFQEKKTIDLKSLDANGFCQIMLELEYFETILSSYFTPAARDALKSLQSVILDKATEYINDLCETPSHQRKPTRGSEDALSDDKLQGITMSPDDLIALAKQYSSELLQVELERTRINIACFMEPLVSVPENAKPTYPSFQGAVQAPGRNHGMQQTGSPAQRKRR